MALFKLRARLRIGGSRQITESDRRINEQAFAVARGQAELPYFVARGKTRWRAIRDAYTKAATALDATGHADDHLLANDVRDFLDKHPDMNATPEVFAAVHARNLREGYPKRVLPSPDSALHDRGRAR